MVLPITSPSRVTGLWHARLRASDGNDADARLALLPLHVMSYEGILTPLTADDRVRIVNETTSGNGLAEIRPNVNAALGGER